MSKSSDKIVISRIANSYIFQDINMIEFLPIQQLKLIWFFVDLLSFKYPF